MALTKCTVPTDVIGSLGTTTQDRGLTTQQFKDKFDEMPEGIKSYLNDTLTVEVDAHVEDDVTDVNGAHGLKIESGTFTPTITGSSGTSNHTYGAQIGYYYKSGNLVHCDIYINMTAKDVNMAGTVQIDGLPFALKNVLNYYASASIGYLQNVNLSAGKLYITGMANYNGTFVALFELDNITSYAALPASGIQSNSSIALSITYQI